MRTWIAGLVLIAIGAVLLLAVSAPLQFLNVKVVGLILIIAGLVTARVPQRASGWLWRNRREVMTALDAPPDAIAAPRVPLDTLLVTSVPVRDFMNGVDTRPSRTKPSPCGSPASCSQSISTIGWRVSS